MVVIGLPTIASEETTCLGVVNFPVFSTYPTKLVTTVPIAACCHVVTVIVLFNRRLALRTRSGVCSHPEPLSDIVKGDAIHRFLPVVDLSHLLRYLLLPLLKSFAVYWPMYRFRTTRETKSMRCVGLHGIASQLIVGIKNAIVSQRAAEVLQ